MTPIKPNHKSIKQYHQTLHQFAAHKVHHESAVRSAFQRLLEDTAKARKWMLVPELAAKSPGKLIRPDGTLRDQNGLPRGYWEAKDTRDDLGLEISAKIAKGYPLTNTIFEDTQKAVLYQNKTAVGDYVLTDPQQVADLLNAYFEYTEPNIEEFEKAVDRFKERVPDLARGLAEKIRDAHKSIPKFQQTFDTFFDLCKTSLNPNLRKEAVDEMLVQHLLTERLIRTIFNNEDFIKRNAIAVEVEKVIGALVSKSFNRHEFLKNLDPFYLAIENAARTLEDFTEKQHFLNTVYERFFQGYCVKVADTHGIVYTPVPIVDFMCNSVVEVLKTEFGKELGDGGVNVLDPCTGTGNFIVHLMQRVSKKNLPKMYREQLFANEVMLLPYYIASLNIEHAYYELAGEYEPFEGLCFTDTLDLAEDELPGQDNLFSLSEENAERVERQKQSPITVILGNPPYNAGQINENDNNKNRKYKVVDRRIHDTYSRDSKATNKNALSDMYVKFFRWATDRLNGRDGIVCFVTNNGFLQGYAFDGFRKHLMQDFNLIYHFDFKGNARTSAERRRQEGGNIFSDQIRVGIGITLLARTSQKQNTKIFYHSVEDYWKAEEKKQYLVKHDKILKIKWDPLKPDSEFSWMTVENTKEYSKFLLTGCIDTKNSNDSNSQSIFKKYCRGVETCRDAWVYNPSLSVLKQSVLIFIENYNIEIDRWKRNKKPVNIDEFVNKDERKIKWCSKLKEKFKHEIYGNYNDCNIKMAMYRPFCKAFLYFDDFIIHRRSLFPHIYPKFESHLSNNVICFTTPGCTKDFHCIIADCFPDLHLTGDSQCFPYYTYDEDGGNQRENVTDWALEQFREHYQNPAIGKWDIFYYVYGLLHHPDYRERYADCLKRELPRIPFAPDFDAFSQAGKELADLHLNYESAEEYKLQWIETPDIPLSYRVEKMRLSADKTTLTVNNSLALSGIPSLAFEYRLGNRSALEWVIDQYRVKEDPRSGVVSDPNREDDPEYIVRLVGKVITISLRTVEIVNHLPNEFR